MAKSLDSHSSVMQVIWLGYASFLLQIDGKSFFIDPMFSNHYELYFTADGNPESKDLPIEVKELSLIDAIIISHDHYNHLNYH